MKLRSASKAIAEPVVPIQQTAIPSSSAGEQSVKPKGRAKKVVETYEKLGVDNDDTDEPVAWKPPSSYKEEHYASLGGPKPRELEDRPDIANYAEELHAPYTRPKQTRHVVTMGMDDEWACDTLFANEDKDKGDAIDEACGNGGFIGAIGIIDCFTRYAWAVPVKSAKLTETWAAFAYVFKTYKCVPCMLWANEGGEFKGDLIKNAEHNHIEIIHTYSNSKSVMAERMNRTIKEKLAVLKTTYHTTRWIDLLPIEMKQYNTEDKHCMLKHSVLGMTPEDA